MIFIFSWQLKGDIKTAAGHPYHYAQFPRPFQQELVPLLPRQPVDALNLAFPFKLLALSHQIKMYYYQAILNQYIKYKPHIQTLQHFWIKPFPLLGLPFLKSFQSSLWYILVKLSNTYFQFNHEFHHLILLNLSIFGCALSLHRYKN